MTSYNETTELGEKGRIYTTTEENVYDSLMEGTKA
jgi:hypothetical protein